MQISDHGANDTHRPFWHWSQLIGSYPTALCLGCCGSRRFLFLFFLPIFFFFFSFPPAL
ncbi:hypothetical protein V8C40DRAFT_240780 [Trichoderma camerunense]